MSLLENYASYLESDDQGYLIEPIISTANSLLDKYILPGFNWGDGHKTGMLLGHVQSGKTSHVLGVIAKAADEGFNIFLLLTTDNIYLQRQTFKRVVEALDGFNVCDESDEMRFMSLAKRKPTVIVLKKNAHVLRSWSRRLSASDLFPGNPVFIVDDEADAISLNTKVNKKDVSTINAALRQIRNLSKAGVYLQVTATPQSLLLQTALSRWQPQFVEVFKPGKSYIGGDFFFSEDNVPSSVKLTDDQELLSLLTSNSYASDGLTKAIVSFLFSTAHLKSKGNFKVCNFVVHPSVKTGHHSQIAAKVNDYIEHLSKTFNLPETTKVFHEIYDDLKSTKPDLIDYETTVDLARSFLLSRAIQIKVMNSTSKSQDYSEGINILVGGNSLSRGITFPKLQTMYYCRTAKMPQADTIWQHCRMFGYDRDQGLVRAFMPPRLYRALTEVNSSNNSIFAQVTKNGVDKLRIFYPSSLKPTRSQVLDLSQLTVLAGGVNYFPFLPENEDLNRLDDILSPFDEKTIYEVNPNLMAQCLAMIKNEDNSEWSNIRFINFIKAYMADKPGEQGILIVRRERDISKGTGTLLSPNDRSLGQNYPDHIVLTLYRIKGSKEKNWNGHPLWIPNVKFPETMNFYDIRN